MFGESKEETVHIKEQELGTQEIWCGREVRSSHALPLPTLNLEIATGL